MARAKNHNLLIAMCSVIAGMGLIGAVLNFKAMMRDRTLAESVAAQESRSDSNLSKNISAPLAEPEQPKKADGKIDPSPTSSAEVTQKKPLPSKEELAKLVEKSKHEAEICKTNVAKAKAKLSKSLMSAEEFKHALNLLEESYLIPPSSQEIFSMAEDGVPANWDFASLGECDSTIHYKLLKSIVEKATKNPDKFPKEQIRSAVRAFLTEGSEKASPLSIIDLRISMIQTLLENKAIGMEYEPQISKLHALAQDLMERSQSAESSSPEELEKSKTLREMYLSLNKAVWMAK